MAIRKLITILIRPVLLLVALGINNRQGHVAGLWVIVLSFCWFLLHFDLLGPIEFIAGQGNGLSK